VLHGIRQQLTVSIYILLVPVLVFALVLVPGPGLKSQVSNVGPQLKDAVVFIFPLVTPVFFAFGAERKFIQFSNRNNLKSQTQAAQYRESA
jgi:hypothetical protein